MALLRFAEAQVDLAFIETGLGGRLDATNVVDPELSIITSVSLDHIEQLGDTIEQISSEKAGIIKPGKPVLIGKLPAEAEALVRKVAQQNGCPVTSVCERFPDVDALPETNLAGSCQRWNAATAVAATEILSDRFPIQPALTAAALQTHRLAGPLANHSAHRQNPDPRCVAQSRGFRDARRESNQACRTAWAQSRSSSQAPWANFARAA